MEKELHGDSDINGDFHCYVVQLCNSVDRALEIVLREQLIGSFKDYRERLVKQIAIGKYFVINGLNISKS